MYGLVFKIHKLLILKQFSDCCRVGCKKKKALSGYTHLVYLPAKIRTNRKTRFLKKKIPQHFNQSLLSLFNGKCFCFQTFFVIVCIVSQEFCILLFGFCFLWFLSCSVG